MWKKHSFFLVFFFFFFFLQRRRMTRFLREKVVHFYCRFWKRALLVCECARTYSRARARLSVCWCAAGSVVYSFDASNADRTDTPLVLVVYTSPEFNMCINECVCVDGFVAYTIFRFSSFHFIIILIIVGCSCWCFFHWTGDRSHVRRQCC